MKFQKTYVYMKVGSIHSFSAAIRQAIVHALFIKYYLPSVIKGKQNEVLLI